MENAPFRRLTCGLRARIWTHALTFEDEVALDEPLTKRRSALLQTCHQIRNEARPIFFAQNSIILGRTNKNCKHQVFWGQDDNVPIDSETYPACHHDGPCRLGRVDQAVDILRSLDSTVLGLIPNMTIYGYGVADAYGNSACPIATLGGLNIRTAVSSDPKREAQRPYLLFQFLSGRNWKHVGNYNFFPWTLAEFDELLRMYKNLGLDLLEADSQEWVMKLLTHRARALMALDDLEPSEVHQAAFRRYRFDWRTGQSIG